MQKIMNALRTFGSWICWPYNYIHSYLSGKFGHKTWVQFVSILPYVLVLSLVGLIFLPSEPTSISSSNDQASLKVKVSVIDSQFATNPKYLDVQGGDRLEFTFEENEGFFIDGEHMAKTLFPYSNQIYLQLTTPNGKKFRMPDKTTGLHIETGGNIQFSLGGRNVNELRIWSGKNMDAKRLSEFKQGSITLVARKVKAFNPNTMLAKTILDHPIRLKIRALSDVDKKIIDDVRETSAKLREGLGEIKDYLIGDNLQTKTTTPK